MRHYEQDRSALKKKEWERRTQEVQQDEDLFSSGFNLFGEPYKIEASSHSTLGGTHNPDNKTNKGDALANRVQNTLGNYDEVKELLTNHSNQSHLVGIPKNSVPQTPAEKEDPPGFFPEGPKGRTAPPSHQSSGPPGSSMPPPPSSSLPGPALPHGHQGAKKSRSTDWPRGGHGSGQGAAGPQCGRGKHGASSHELPHGRYEDQFGSQGDASPVAVSSHPRRHVPPPKSSSSSSSSDHAHGEGARCRSPAEQDIPGSHGPASPVASTSLLPSGLSTPNFPPGLHCKPSATQQKPTAYVRPMDGQDQVPNDSPEIKHRPEIGDGYGVPAFGGLTEGKGGAGNGKSKLPKLSLPQSGESLHIGKDSPSWPRTVVYGTLAVG
ncbi:hypothetical protein AAFF_G00017940 [Aldrovandia affinis]|uniref:Uncharacterized protein n=1 Tax=Aldrovandia affinis TaxID=143900 RepID=A0AAD7S5T9_9TELE|nr:hypothetical protein AAFF_G00017940 [Aldrovandia affinis]